MVTRKEMQMIAALRKNSRTSLAKISEDISVSKSTVFDRLKRHEGNLIQKHTSLIDFQKLGFASRTFVIIKTTVGERGDLQDYLKKHKNINNLFVINGGFDFFIDIIFKDVKEMGDFLCDLRDRYTIEKIRTNTVINDIKRESFLEEV